jgi:hypothetical protein
MLEDIVWEPQPRQHMLLSCPIEDILFGGARGGGKTDGLLGDFLAHALRFPAYAQGIFFRRSYPELEEVERRAQDIFPASGAKWLAAKRTWQWPTGAFLRMRYMERETDHTNYQGHQYTWMAFDEVTNWPSPDGLDKLRACLRSPHGVPCYLRCSGNPGGVGHNWVKARYVDPAPPLYPFAATEHVGADAVTIKRIYIPSTLDDNFLLMRHDPHYWERLVLAAGGRDDILKAWRYGLWDIVAGGYFDDLWRPEWHIVDPFPIPATWGIRRAFDWGSSDPFSVGWWAHSDGATPVPNGRIYPKNTRFRIMELYGWNGKPNEGVRFTTGEIARRIAELEAGSSYAGRIQPGPADTSIFDVVNGTSLADEMAGHGIGWTAAQKGRGSRRQGWQVMRQLLKASMQWPMEQPGLFVFATCRQFIRTVPVLPRDPMDPDDVDTDAEDHIADESRYECTMPFFWQAWRTPLKGY